MKKILLAAAFCAIASLNSFGACTNGTLAAVALAGPCTVGAGDVWTLSNFLLFNAGGLGYTGTQNENDIFVSFTNVMSGGGGAGFAVAFSDAAGGENFFSATSAGASQSQNWRTFFNVLGPVAVTVNNSWQNANVTNPAPGVSNGSISLNKVIRNGAVAGAAGVLGDVTLLAVPGLLLPPSGSANVIFQAPPNTTAFLAVVDNYQIQAGVNGTASLTSYTNTFYAADPTNGIPEPMTFVLMGAGLVGIAALRRRNG